MQQRAITDEARAALLSTQEANWKRALDLGRGNPLATLCLHCYGRHRPPHNELCPHDPPPAAKR